MTDINELAGALSAFQGEVSVVTFDKEVTVKTTSGHSYGYEYASLSAIRTAIKDPMSKNGLAYVQLVSTDLDKMRHMVTTRLMHKSGQSVESTMVITPDNQKMQSVGSAISYAKRYQLSAILGIVTDSDDDGSIASDVDAEIGPKKNTESKKNTGAVEEVPVKKPTPRTTAKNNTFKIESVDPCPKCGSDRTMVSRWPENGKYFCNTCRNAWG